MRRQVAVLVLGVVLASGAHALPAAPTLELHASITIEGDAAFGADGSGVRRGSGTPDDPYVISRWTIVQTRAWGILLRNTTAHVVIEDVRLPPMYGNAWDALDCERGSWDGCPGDVGIAIVDASNVTLRNLHLSPREFTLVPMRAQDIRLHDIHIDEPLFEDSWVSIGLLDSWRVDVARITRTATQPTVAPLFQAVRGGDLRVHDVAVVGAPFTDDYPIMLNGPMRRVALERLTFEHASVFMSGSFDGLRLEGSTFMHGSFGVGVPRIENATACGNLFVDGAFRGGNVANLTLRGNVFDGGVEGIRVGPVVGLVVEENSFRAHTRRSVDVAGTDARLSGNAFHGSNQGVQLLLQQADARENWWADASGPSGAGPGEGERLTVGEATALALEPWLVAPPELARGCA